MRCIVVDSAGGAPTIRPLKTASRLLNDEVRLKTSVVGICQTDLHYGQGKIPTTFPTVLGHEASAIVTEVGGSVVGIAEGDRVVACLSVYCGQCRMCVSGKTHLCMNKAATRRTAAQPPRLQSESQVLHQFLDIAAFAEELIVHRSAVAPIPDGLSLEHGALLGCSVTTGFGAVLRTAGVQPGQSVVVLGCGSVGMSCVQASAVARAGLVIAVDSSERRRELALRLGAAMAFPPDSGVLNAVLGATGGGADHAFEAVGLPSTIRLAFDMLAPGGTATVAGAVPAGVEVALPGFDLLYEKRLQGCNMGSNRPQEDIPTYANFAVDGLIDLDSMISKRVGLEDVPEVLRAGLQGLDGRTLVHMT